MTSWRTRHPCFGVNSGQTRAGRIHLPVSRDCNIRCRFCARALSTDIACPGHAARVLTVDEALAVLARALRICPEIQVVGVAGPGDPLASPHALELFRKVHVQYPNLINCLSTNGLALTEAVPALADAGVQTLTVTVNAVAPPILAQLCAGIRAGGKWREGTDGAGQLIDAQRIGIRLARAYGLTVKVNTVLTPGINDGHIGRVAETVAEWGASFINLIPLLPAAEFEGRASPGCLEVEAARAAAERFLPVFRHCRRCRADACGIPGGLDHAKELYADCRTEETFSHG